MYRWFKKHTKDGLETPDPTPIEVNLPRPLTLAEQILRFTGSPEVRRQMQEKHMETFEEADDLDVDDDLDGKVAPYEEAFVGSEMRPHVQTRLDEIHAGMVEDIPEDRLERAKDRIKAKKNSPPPVPPTPPAQ